MKRGALTVLMTMPSTGTKVSITILQLGNGQRGPCGQKIGSASSTAEESRNPLTNVESAARSAASGMRIYSGMAVTGLQGKDQLPGWDLTVRSMNIGWATSTAGKTPRLRITAWIVLSSMATTGSTVCIGMEMTGLREMMLLMK